MRGSSPGQQAVRGHEDQSGGIRDGAGQIAQSILIQGPFVVVLVIPFGAPDDDIRFRPQGDQIAGRGLRVQKIDRLKPWTMMAPTCAMHMRSPVEEALIDVGAQETAGTNDEVDFSTFGRLGETVTPRWQGLQPSFRTSRA